MIKFRSSDNFMIAGTHGRGMYSSNSFGCAPSCFTCNDGIQNGSESGVDCGGDMCDPCECDNTNRTFNGSTLNNDITRHYKESVEFRGDVNVKSNADVKVHAGQEHMISGTFSMEPGALFFLGIEDCDDSNLIQSTVSKKE